LKEDLTASPVLACPDFERTFVLQTDASTTGLSAVLTQFFPEGERVIAYASRTLNTTERNYSATELECMAVLWGIRKMRGYLERYHFKVITDHQALKLQKLDSPTGRLGRWAFELQQYDFEVQYRKGSLNKVADALSRQVASIKRATCAWYRRMGDVVRTEPHKAPDYRLQDGVLYKHILHRLDFKELDPAEQWKRCIPKEERPEILRRSHDEITAGHLGIAKTIARIAEHYYWPGMFRDIAQYVRKCPSCIAHKVTQRKPPGLMQPTDHGSRSVST